MSARKPKPATVPYEPPGFAWPDDKTVPREACPKCLEPVFTVASRVGTRVFLLGVTPTTYAAAPFVLDRSVGARWSTTSDHGTALPRLARHECNLETLELPLDSPE